jgi:histidinol-phosphate aminotransferase
MSALTNLARPAVRSLKPYVSARSITSEGRVFLDANESPESGVPERPAMNRYPEPQPRALLDRFAQIYGVAREQLLVGRGSDEAIELLVRAFCEAGTDGILITPPTYGVYEIAAEIQGARVLRVPLAKANGWRLDEEKIVSAALEADARIKLVFLCSPNNPTGTAFSPAVMTRIAARIGERALVIVDEAYGEWSAQESMLSRLPQLPNLVVLRTLSKAWGVAGARCGVAIAHPEILDLLNRIRAPYPLSQPSIELALQALSPEAALRLRERVLRVRTERARMTAALLELSNVARVDPSEGNFLLVEFKDREALLAGARERGIVLRDRHSDVNLANCVRITIGTPRENDEVLALARSVSPMSVSP